MSIVATIDNIGEWDGQEQAAVVLWNHYIAPALASLIEYQGIDPDDMATVSVQPARDGKLGIAANADHWAWSEFCGRLGQVEDITTDEAKHIVMVLALELRKRGMTAKTNTLTAGNYRIILDNGGGITLQLGPDYAHCYQDEAQAACDLRDYITGSDTSDWDGCEPEAVGWEPEAEEIRNGGYRVYCDVDDLDLESGWGNEVNLAQAYRNLI